MNLYLPGLSLTAAAWTLERERANVSKCPGSRPTQAGERQTHLNGGGLLLVGGEDLAGLLCLDGEEERQEGAQEEVDRRGAHCRGFRRWMGEAVRARDVRGGGAKSEIGTSD